MNYHGGIEPVDLSLGGDSNIFAFVPSGNAGRIIVWGDEWITFDSDWAGYAHVEDFWARMIAWVQPEDFCAVPPIID